VAFMAAQGVKKEQARANDDFLLRLAGAEARDSATAKHQQPPPPPPPPQPKQLGPAGDETMREIEDAEAALRAREEKMARYQSKRPLSAAELEAASELFWEHDADANAMIDRNEWRTLINEVARRTGRQPFTQHEADVAFASADVDGNGQLDLHEWIAAQSAALSHSPPATSDAAHGHVSGSGNASSVSDSRGGEAGRGASHGSRRDGGGGEASRRMPTSLLGMLDRPRATASEGICSAPATAAAPAAAKKGRKGSNRGTAAALAAAAVGSVSGAGGASGSTVSVLESAGMHVRFATAEEFGGLDHSTHDDTIAAGSGTAAGGSSDDARGRSGRAYGEPDGGGGERDSDSIVKRVETTEWWEQLVGVTDMPPGYDAHEGRDGSMGGANGWMNSVTHSFKRLVGSGSASSSFVKRMSDASQFVTDSFKRRPQRGSAERRHRRHASSAERALVGADKADMGEGDEARERHHRKNSGKSSRHGRRHTNRAHGVSKERRSSHGNQARQRSG